MTKYKQLSQEQRYVIGRLLKAGNTQEEIATAVGFHKSTISRELKRNMPMNNKAMLTLMAIRNTIIPIINK